MQQKWGVTSKINLATVNATLVVFQVARKIVPCNMALISGVYDHVTKMVKVVGSSSQDGINPGCFVLFLSEKSHKKKPTVLFGLGIG